MTSKAVAKLLLYGVFLLGCACLTVVVVLELSGVVHAVLFDEHESVYVAAGPYLAPVGVLVFGYLFWNTWEDRMYE